MTAARRIVRIGSVPLALAFVIAGCGLFGEESRRLPCPNILILSEAEHLVRFRPGEGRDLTDLVFRASIIDFTGHCEHLKDRVDATFDVVFDIRRGAANKDRRASFEYFVALPRFHPTPEGKRKFQIAVSFEKNRTRVVFRDRISLKIPLDPNETGANHDVYLGLQLAPTELEFNRRSKKL